jgi:hypothetical protein
VSLSEAAGPSSAFVVCGVSGLAMAISSGFTVLLPVHRFGVATNASGTKVGVLKFKRRL